MSADTNRLIAQARNSAGHLYSAEMLALADALEAAEALHQGQRAAKMDALARAEAAEAQRDTLAEALDWIEAQPEDPVKVQLWARAALAGVAPTEEPKGGGHGYIDVEEGRP